MRNAGYLPECGCGPIVGEIKHGCKYPFGTVTVEEFREVIADLNNEIERLNGVITLMDSNFNALSERVSILEGGALVINSMSATPRAAEIGSVVNVTIDWNLSRPAKRADINGIDVTRLTNYVASNVSTTTEYKLSVYDEKDRKVTASAKIEFQNHIFWGVSADTHITETLVKQLDNNILSGAKSRKITVSPADQHVYYAYPKRLGTSTFKLGIFTGGFLDPETIRITNNAGYTEDYYVYRSNQKFTYENVEFEIS